MVIINSMLQLIPGMIESFILWRVLTCVMIPRYSKTIMSISAVVMILLDGLKIWILSMSGMERYHIFGMLAVMLYILGTFFFLTNNTIVEKLAWWGIYLFILIIMEMAAVIILGSVLENPLELYASNNPVNLFVIIIIKILTLLLFEVIIRKRKGHPTIGISFFKELIIVIFFNLLLILVVTFTFTNRHTIVNKIDNIILLLFGVVLFITIYTVMLIFRIEKKSNEEIETQLKLQQIEMELKQSHDMIDMTDRLKKLHHDMTKHIGLIRTLIQDEKYGELEAYIDQIYGEAELANDLVLSENKILSVLLSAKKALAREKKIQFTSTVAVEEIEMANKDLSLLLSNLLDNAIDAAQTVSGRKFIEFSIQRLDNAYIIHCENSFELKPVMKKEKFISSKDNNILLSIEAENIKEIVAKYHGEISFEYDDAIFGVHIVIPAGMDFE